MIKLLLALQTILPTQEMALFEITDQKPKLLKQLTWQSNSNELAEIFPKLQQILEEYLPSPSIKSVVVANGFGPFSSTRIGVTIANTIPVASPQAKLFSFLLKNKDSSLSNPPNQTSQNSPNPHGSTVTASFNNSANSLPYQNLTDFITQNFSELQNPQNLILPEYASEPKITPSKKPQFF